MKIDQKVIKKQKGGMMFEYLLVIGFLILSSILIIMIYKKHQEIERVKETIDMIQYFNNQVPKLLMKNNSEGRYKLNNSDYLIKNNIGKDYYEDGAYINPFNGKVNIVSTTINKPNDGLSITMENITNKQCFKIAYKLQENNYKIIKINEKLLTKKLKPYENDEKNICEEKNNRITVIN